MPQPPHSWRDPSDGTTVPDSPLDWDPHHLIRIHREDQSSNANNLPRTEIFSNSVPLASTVRPRVTFADQSQTTDAGTASDSRRQTSSTQKLELSSSQTSTQGRTNDLDPWVWGVFKRATQGTGTSCAQATGYGQTGYAPTASFVS
jgi:hypothetical protein